MLSPFWRTEKLEARDEAAIIREFGALIPVADHRFRMERMFYADRVNSAQRVAGLAGAQQLADAWAAASRGDKNAAEPAEGRARRAAFGRLFLRASRISAQAARSFPMPPRW